MQPLLKIELDTLNYFKSKGNSYSKLITNFSVSMLLRWFMTIIYGGNINI